MPIYVAGDVRAIQSYVFASPRLLEMRGASALVDFFDRAVVPWQVSHLGGELISSGGGNFLARFDGGPDRGGRVEELRRRLLGAFLDLTGGQELLIESLDSEEPFRSAQARLHDQLRRAKHQPGGDRQLASMPFLKRCESCGREAADVARPLPGAEKADPRRQWVGPSCDRKRWMHEELATARKQGGVPRQGVYGVNGPLDVPAVTEGLRKAKLPADFEELVGSDDLAILVADGNGLGGWFRSLESPKAYRELSAKLDRTLRDALDAAAREAFGGDGEPPLQVLICGGDDLVVALPARYATMFACKLMEEFRVPSPADPGRQTGLAAGLLISKHGFPFRQAHGLAVELLGWAKRRCREEGLLSALQLHRVTATQVQSLDAERAQLERDDGNNRGWAYGMAGPYSPDELRALIGLAGELRAKVSPSQRGRLREILSPRDDSRESPLHATWQVPARVVVELEAWRVRQEEPAFNQPFQQLKVRYLRMERARRSGGTKRTYQRWVLADALTLAALPEA